MHMRNANIVKSDRGQTIVIFALILPILILFAGLAIDVGFFMSPRPSYRRLWMPHASRP